ncbi:MAG: multicopper oxidase domain-containing protein [candidate division NC10 bacterium]|nr:multicopper oxidase domain-containing protein [candidate division NC10 bacterium]
MRYSLIGSLLIGLLALPFQLASAQEVKKFVIIAEEKRIDVGEGFRYDAWTYNGTVPGPVIRVHEGDDVEITLVNKGKVAHGIDTHAAQISPGRAFRAVDPGASHTFRFRAEAPGVFLYHCSAPPILNHIANGLYGAMIVEPRKGFPPAREFVVVQGELYGEPDSQGLIAGDTKKMSEERPDFVIFDGAINRHVGEPLPIKAGELVRVYFVNAGPNLVSSFHIIGTLLRTVYVGGNPENRLRGVQTFEVGPGNGAILEFMVKEPGDYPLVDHAIARVYKGAVALFRTEGYTPAPGGGSH